VTACDFLAYSCAAARELHPLPCLRHKAKTRKPKDIRKNENAGSKNLPGQALEVNRRTLVWWRSRLTNANKPPKGPVDYGVLSAMGIYRQPKDQSRWPSVIF
jgi:hypothetical protein